MLDDHSERRAALWHLWAVGGLAILWDGLGTVLWGGTSFMPRRFLDVVPAPIANM